MKGCDFMRQIIKGKIYDTKYSKLISKKTGPEVFYELYKAKNGQYFFVNPRMNELRSGESEIHVPGVDFVKLTLSKNDPNAYNKEFGKG